MTAKRRENKAPSYFPPPDLNDDELDEPLPPPAAQDAGSKQSQGRRRPGRSERAEQREQPPKPEASRQPAASPPTPRTPPPPKPEPEQRAQRTDQGRGQKSARPPEGTPRTDRPPPAAKPPQAGKSPQGNRPAQTARPEQGKRSEPPSRPARAEKAEQPASQPRTDRPPRTEKPHRPDQPRSGEPPVQPNKPPVEQAARTDRPPQTDRPARTEKPPRTEPTRTGEPPVRPDKPSAEQAARADRPPRPEKPPRAERPPQPDRPPRPERPPKPEKQAGRRQPFPGKYVELSLSDKTFAALEAAGYFDPTPVQAGLIPRALTGVDVMAQAQTGTGKTASFVIPILERLETGEDAPSPQALVLVPTRELAVQVRDEFEKLALGRNLEIVALYGGKPIRKQTEQLRRGIDIAVGTPGRILDHMGRGSLNLGGVRIAVLDEADRMLDIGFRPDIEKILRRCPESRQTLLLSATIPGPVERLARQYMHEPESLNFSPTDVAVETIEQFYFTVDPENKFDLLVKLLERENAYQAIIFCRTRRGTERIYEKLSRKVDDAATIHGDLAQRTRDRVMEQFRKGKVRYLVATDVVGRGIDVTSISHIINYDIPQFADDYVHRVGRTGRMGREGVAYTFVAPEEGSELTRIEMRINRLLKRAEMPGFATFAKPEAVEPTDEQTAAKPATKPVFGRSQRRVRRAL